MTADDLSKQIRILQARLEHIKAVKEDFYGQNKGLEITYHSLSGVMMAKVKGSYYDSSITTIPACFVTDMLTNVERFITTEIGVLKLRLELHIDDDQ